MLREDPTVWLGICKTLDFNWKMRHNSYMMIDKEMTVRSVISRKFLEGLSFRVFSDSDYNGFEGVMSPVPLIAETDEYLVIIDGDRCEVYTEGDFVDFCDNVTELA